MIWRFCVDCKKTVEKDELATILAIRGNQEDGVLVGICRPCYGPEWHTLLYGGEDDDGFVDELVDEALKRLERK